jgi:hypothetical protein
LRKTYARRDCELTSERFVVNAKEKTASIGILTGSTNSAIAAQNATTHID